MKQGEFISVKTFCKTISIYGLQMVLQTICTKISSACVAWINK